jgi:hypothetical protein
MSEVTYVYDNVEVRKTGRTATNTLPSKRVDIVHEVTPVDTIVGTWKKWVRDDVLFVVKNDSK